jgi:Cu(I)/Ag(I) efflux system membrane protein CusA/SilA
MIDAIIRWCLRNTFLVLVAVTAIVAGTWWAIGRIPVDAIPDIGEKQVIVMAEWEGRSPQDVDDQVTFPLVTALSGTPGVKTIRSMSGFGFGMAFVIFKDEADYYWARSRVLERLNIAQQRLPAGVVPVLGPDATALGQVYWYTIEGDGFDLAELRSLQDWFVRYQLTAVEGVSEVSGVGGFVKQYQIDVDPDKLRAYGVTLPELMMAVQRSNLDVGAKVIERNGLEYVLRGVGFVKTIGDIEKIVVRAMNGVPVLVGSVATVSLGPDFRRGALDRAGKEAVGGVVVMRFGENPLRVVERVKAKIEQIQAFLPTKTLADGTVSQARIVPFYDRTDIVGEAVATLREALSEEALLAALIIIVFLLHLRSAIAPILTLPLSIGVSFIVMERFGVDANIMSLAGLAIAIGDVGDMAIIMTENIYRHVADRKPDKKHWQAVYDGACEVGRPIVTAVANTLVSFIPVFLLEDQEGKLFTPLAYTKTFAIAAAVVLAITVVPVICLHVFRPISWSRTKTLILSASIGLLAAVGVRIALGMFANVAGWAGLPTAIAIGILVALSVARMRHERFLPLEQNLVGRGIAKVYAPVLRWVLDHKKSYLAVPVSILLAGFTVWLGLGTVLKPVEWAINAVAGARSVEFGALAWQTVRESDGRVHSRMRWRGVSHAEHQAGVTGSQVISETRILPGIGREFMPALDEGSFLAMPSVLAQASLSEVVKVNAAQDEAIATIPEVASVVGKVGRANSALDPAPIGMLESIVVLKPESQWRNLPVERWFSAWPGWLKAPLAWLAPEQRRITKAEILADMQAATHMPGVLPTWLQPIQTRLVMLQTGFRAMMGVKIYGQDLREIERIGIEMERVLRTVPGATDVVADRSVGKPYLEFVIDRERIARFGVRIQDVNDVITTALGGMNLTETVEGRERYPVRIRYARDLRDDLPELDRILVSSMDGTQVPISRLCDIRTVVGPQEIKGERGLLVGYVTMNTRDRDEIGVVEDAEKTLRQAVTQGSLTVPSGYYWEWSGQFENQRRATARMALLVPACLLIMFIMLYISFRRWWIAPLIFASIMCAAGAGFIAVGFWGANLSVAVWVGFLVLFGVADDDGVVMSTYLENAFAERRFASIAELRETVVQTALKRIRPALMTIATTSIGLLPIFWSTGRGSDVMQPMAIPSVGGIGALVVLGMTVPCVFAAVEEWKWRRARRAEDASTPEPEP